jgi:hypothetical protein
MVGLYTNRHSLGPWPQTPVRSRSGLPLRNQPVPWHVADPKTLSRRLDGRLLVGGIKRNRASSSSLVPAANQRQPLSSRSLVAVHDRHERSEFGRMQASRRPNQR